MNISSLDVLGSVISNHQVSEDHLLYIGMGIGLSSGLLCASIIAHYKYIRFKASLTTNVVPNDKDDDATIAVIIDYFHTRQSI